MRAPQPPRPRERVPSDEELKRVWHAAREDSFGRIVKLLILTGRRVGEISSLTGSMIGDDCITLPAWLTKNGREHRIPIGRMAKALLNVQGTPDAPLFTAHDGRTKFASHSVCKRRLDARCGVADWRLHDLRRTFASGLASIGEPLPVIERLLNHISGSFGGIVGVYQRYDFAPEMRKAMERWESHVKRRLADPMKKTGMTNLGRLERV